MCVQPGLFLSHLKLLLLSSISKGRRQHCSIVFGVYIVVVCI